MRRKNKDDYKVIFGGASISKQEANKIVLTLFIGLVGASLSFFLFGIQDKIAILAISVSLAVFGYFAVANTVFK